MIIIVRTIVVIIVRAIVIIIVTGRGKEESPFLGIDGSHSNTSSQQILKQTRPSQIFETILLKMVKNVWNHVLRDDQQYSEPHFKISSKLLGPFFKEIIDNI